MSRKCDLTGKSSQFGNTRSKALNSSRTKWNVNLQPVKVKIDGKTEKLMLSAKMIKTIKNKGNFSIYKYK